MSLGQDTKHGCTTGLRSVAFLCLAAAAFSAGAAEEPGESPQTPADEEPEVEREKPRRRPSRRRGPPRKPGAERARPRRPSRRRGPPRPVRVKAPKVQPVPEPRVRKPPRPPRDPAECWRLGLRTALVFPGPGESRDYGMSGLLGLSLSPPARGRPGASWELGLDYGGRGESDGYESSLLGGRVDFLFPFLEGRAYALSGVGAFAEFVEDVYRDERRTNAAAALDFGCGYVFGKRLDARLTYSVWLGSENLTGQALMSMGYCF